MSDGLDAEAQPIFLAVWTRWLELQPLSLPASSPLVLWQVPNLTIGVAAERGPVVPYPPIQRHSEAQTNHGYVQLKGNLHLVGTVPELKNWPEYADLVRKVNDDASPVESVGCDVGMFPSDLPGLKHRVGAYLDLVYSDRLKAQSPEECLRGAATLIASLQECGEWWSRAEIGLQSLYRPGGVVSFGVVLRISSYGETEEQARLHFARSLEELAAAIPHL